MRALSCGWLFLTLSLTPVWADVPGMEAISAVHAEDSVDYLASDALEGRGSGAEGGHKAGDWLAQQLANLGLEPLGEEGTYYQPFDVGELHFRNVVARIPGREPGEAVVIGAHYDHLGLGLQPGSLAFLTGRGRIHNGADDNASGTAAVLEIARAFVASGRRPRRDVILVWFDAEERGLLGSKHFLADPPTHDHVVLMINLDMVGRLRNHALTIDGATTGDLIPGWLEQANAEVGLKLDVRQTINANSDHAPFYQAGIPVLVPFTGLHADYHRPSDDADKVDVQGIAQVARLCYGVAVEAADSSQQIAFSKARDGTAEVVLEEVQAFFKADRLKEELQGLRERLGLKQGGGLRDLGQRLRQLLRGDRGGDRPRLGVRIDGGAEGPGVRVASVDAGSVAAAAGLQAGDAIVGFAGQPVEDLAGLRQRVQGAQGRVSVEVLRGGERVRLSADFGGGEEEQEAPPPSQGGGRRYY